MEIDGGDMAFLPVRWCEEFRKKSMLIIFMSSAMGSVLSRSGCLWFRGHPPVLTCHYDSREQAYSNFGYPYDVPCPVGSGARTRLGKGLGFDKPSEVKWQATRACGVPVHSGGPKNFRFGLNTRTRPFFSIEMEMWSKSDVPKVKDAIIMWNALSGRAA